MAKYLVERTDADVQAIRSQGDHTDSRRAAGWRSRVAAR
jgi:hypothetical protein